MGFIFRDRGEGEGLDGFCRGWFDLTDAWKEPLIKREWAGRLLQNALGDDLGKCKLLVEHVV